MTSRRKPAPSPAQFKGNRAAATKWRELSELPTWSRAVEAFGSDLLISFCTLHSRLLKAEEALAKNGELVDTPNGYQVQSPWLPIANRCRADMLAITRLVDAGAPGKKEKAASKAAGVSTGKFRPAAPPRLVVGGRDA